MKQSSAGFTLIELLTAILCASIVTVAAMSFLLMGMRMTGESNAAAEQQQTARVLLTMVENMAGSGQIEEVRSGGQGWAVLDGSSGEPLLQYANKTIRSGGTVLMDGLKASTAKLEGSLLTVTVETEKGAYTTSVYCRTRVEQKNAVDEEKTDEILHHTPLIPAPETPDPETPDPETPAPDAPTERESRLEFLRILAEQYGSDGRIIGAEEGEPQYFSEWYVGKYGDENPGWDKDTPWCACFVSWAAEKLGSEALLPELPRFCDVDDGMARFRAGSIGSWHDGGYTPTPGDCIFFDWTGGDDPAHVGVVFFVDGEAGKIYTIEGNSSGRVALRTYDTDDPCIVGYGVLNWKS